jgi:hypothetical protein
MQKQKEVSTLVGIIIIIVVAVVLFGGVFAYQQYLIQKSNIKNQNENVKSQNGTEEWKTYANNEYGFELKYPNNWTFYNPSSDQKAFIIGLYGDPINGSASMIITVSQRSGKILAGWISENHYIFIKNINIDGINGVIVSPAIVFNDANYYNAIFPKGDYMYDISASSDISENPQKIINFLEQIVSTFKFTK